MPVPSGYRPTLGHMPDATPLHILSGKGGTGKTTVALALALMLRRSGETLVCEVEARHGLSEAAGIASIGAGEERRVQIAGMSLRMLSVDSRHALRDYLQSHARLGVAGSVLEKTGFVDFASEIAPGLRDVLLTGKIYQAARRGLKGQAGAVEAVVMDAPPTGRIETFLTAGEALSEVVAVGPIAQQADSIMTFLRANTTRVHLVTTCTEMAVTETLQTLEALIGHGFNIGHVIINQSALAPPRLPDSLTDPSLHAIWKRDIAMASDQRLWTDKLSSRLAELGLGPALTIPMFPDEVNQDNLAMIADQLAKDWMS